MVYESHKGNYVFKEPFIVQELPQNVSKLNNILLEHILVYSPY